MNQRFSWVDWTHTYSWVWWLWSGLCLKISRKKRVSASVINVYCFHSRTVTWEESVTFSLHHCNGDVMQFSRNHIKLLRLSVGLNQNIYLWHIAGRVRLFKDDHAHLWNECRPIEYELFRLPLTHTVSTTIQSSYLRSIISVTPRSIRFLSLIAFAHLSSWLRTAPHCFRYDSPCLWKQLPDSSCQFYFSRFLLSCLCVSGTQGSPAKTDEPITIRLGAGSCGPDEPSRRWAHAGSARWNRPNDPCATAMRPDIKLL